MDDRGLNLVAPLRQMAGRPSKWWAAIGALLVSSSVPCPECGAPLALHIWPLLMLVVIVRTMAGRRARASQQDSVAHHTDRSEHEPSK